VTLTVGIATFNGRHLLEATLPSVMAQTLRPERVIVVDDGSTDGTVEWLRETWPQVEVISHQRNSGITASLNDCLTAGIDADFVALFNNDVELAPGCLETLRDALLGDPVAAASGPKMLDYEDRAMLDGAGDNYFRVGVAQRRGQGQRDVGQYDKPEPVFGVCGGAALFRSSALRELGLFDEDFGAYYEDVDWSLRANLAGYRCLYEPRAVVYHMSGATTGFGLNHFSGYHSWRNSIWVLAKNWSLPDALRWSWLIAFGQVWNFGLAIDRRLLGVLLRAWRDAALGLPRMLRKRRSRRRTTWSLRLPLSPRGRSWK
jgi:GT2 family glycosyltransferase